MKRIEISGMGFSYKSAQKVFEDFSLSLFSGEGKGKITAVMGPSGAGKTTLLKLLLGIEKPAEGMIELFPEQPVISYVPQEPVLFEHLSIIQNARYFQISGGYKSFFNEQLFNELIDQLGIADIIHSKKQVTELSGGQKQRLSLLRALSINPDFLLLDEPCNGLDAGVKRSFLNKLREIALRHGLYVLYITHHKLEAQLIADEVVYLVQDRKLHGLVRKAVIAGIVDFSLHPPALDAAEIFRFPDVKILSFIKDGSGRITLTSDYGLATGFYLIEQENIIFPASGGYLFRIVSKSPLFSVLRHEDSGIEWMISSDILPKFDAGSEIRLDFAGEIAAYDSAGMLIKRP
jgi:ABC-type nitrate/sulfonate/bicarbonate transport system ATPase subunit